MLAAEPLVPEDVGVVVAGVLAALGLAPKDFRAPVLKFGANWCSVFAMLNAARLPMIFSPLLLLPVTKS
jgi:hypothetical protein